MISDTYLPFFFLPFLHPAMVLHLLDPAAHTVWYGYYGTGKNFFVALPMDAVIA